MFKQIPFLTRHTSPLTFHSEEKISSYLSAFIFLERFALSYNLHPISNGISHTYQRNEETIFMKMEI